MDREKINRNAEVLRTAKNFEAFVDMLSLPEKYKESYWLEKDYKTLLTHGKVFSQTLHLPEANTIGKVFTNIVGGYGMEQPEKAYYVSGSATPDVPERMFNEKGKFYKSWATPGFSTRHVIEEVLGPMCDTRSFEMIKWDDGSTLIIVSHGSMVYTDRWLAVLPPS